MYGFDKILNWKLLRGSHEFPGPDGGTCITEAAVLAAGFPYRSIVTGYEMPKCFSRTICAFAMFLNDTLDDDNRQRLLPLVMRLAGSADTENVERRRNKKMIDVIGRGIEVFLTTDEITITQNLKDCWLDIAAFPHMFYDHPHSIFTDFIMDLLFHKDNDIVEDVMTQIGIDAIEAALHIGNRPNKLDVEDVRVRMKNAKVALV